MDIIALLNTDPLAQIALAGFVAVLVVTIAVFGFLFLRLSGQSAGSRDKK